MPMTVPTGSSAKATAASAAVLSSLSIFAPFCLCIRVVCTRCLRLHGRRGLTELLAGSPFTPPLWNSVIYLCSPCARISQLAVSAPNEFGAIVLRRRPAGEKIAGETIASDVTTDRLLLLRGDSTVCVKERASLVENRSGDIRHTTSTVRL